MRKYSIFRKMTIGLLSLTLFTLFINHRIVFAENNSGSISMYRLYNPNSWEHFYTGNAKEKDALVKMGWQYEGVGWYAPEKSSTPVYRLYNPNNGGDHHYTKNKKEYDALVKAGWIGEDVRWYSDDTESVPVYREYNPGAAIRNHNYTANKKEHDALIGFGWKNEGIGWYGVNESDVTPTPTPSQKESYKITYSSLTSYLNSFDEPCFIAIVEVMNTGNVSLYLDANSFDIEDANGSLIATETLISNCPDVIAPGEKGYLYLSFYGEYPEGTDVNQKFTLKPDLKIRAATAEPVEYRVYDVKINQSTYGDPEILGRVENTTKEDDSLFYIQAVLYDSSGKPLAITGTNLTDFKAGSTRSFDINFMFTRNVDFSKVVSYKVIARRAHYQFD